jgi:hypothetical protein
MSIIYKALVTEALRQLYFSSSLGWGGMPREQIYDSMQVPSSVCNEYLEHRFDAVDTAFSVMGYFAALALVCGYVCIKGIKKFF